MISDEYKRILTTIHTETKFGKRRKLPDHLENFLEEIKPATLIDFGCGKGNLVFTLKKRHNRINVIGFDPGNPRFDRPLFPVDMIISTDVLEHIEPELLDQTLEEIKQNSRYIYHLISCAPAKLILPDGRNAHLIQESPKWWKEKFESLGYKILKEDYQEFSKYSKQLRRSLPVKNYYIMGVLDG